MVAEYRPTMTLMRALCNRMLSCHHSNVTRSTSMRGRFATIFAIAPAIVFALLSGAACADTAANVAAAAPGASPSGASGYAATSDASKAHELVQAAINMTDSNRAVQLLWRATQIDPTLDEPYVYLGLYYNSRSQFDKVVQVYQQLVKYQPKEVSAYLNIGEAYMSFTPPKTGAALPYYLKAFQLDPGNSFAALRIGQIYGTNSATEMNSNPPQSQRDRQLAMKYLAIASADRAKNPAVAEQADLFMKQMTGS
jgi:tetratricopeptide (TPR) repeat protein